MNAATLAIIVFGLSSEPVVLTYPQPSLRACWYERNVEASFGVMRRNGFQVHALCFPESQTSSSDLILVG